MRPCRCVADYDYEADDNDVAGDYDDGDDDDEDYRADDDDCR